MFQFKYFAKLCTGCIGLLSIGCQEFSRDSKKFELLNASQTGITFQNTIDQNALNVFDYVNMYNGAGVAVSDFNNDGLEDLFFAGNLVSSRLYLNNGKVKPFGFLDKTEASGVATRSWVNGVTIVDIDQNGWDDIYCSVSGGKSGKNRANLLFVNQGIDGNGELRFEERAAEYHLNDTTHTIQSAFFDYDGDQDLDLFMIVNHPTGYLGQEANRIVRIQERGNPERTDRLYRNDGSGVDGHPVFTDVSQEAGITLEGFSLGLAINDFNEDGRPDIYVANDYVTNDIIYVNNGDGTFTDRIRDYVNHTSFASMGIDVADINNDGMQDFMVLDMLPEADAKVKMMYPAVDDIGFGMRKKIGYVDQYNRNTLQLNNGLTDSIPRKFSEIGRFSNVSDTNWSWSTLMPDLDLDGWRDIFVTNGFLKDVNDLDFVNFDGEGPFGKQKKRDDTAYLESLKTRKGLHIPNYLFQNQGDLSFEDKSEEWGFDTPTYSNGAIHADLDNDGDLDLAINNINEPASIYENHSITRENQDKNYLQIVLQGDKPNREAIGASIKFETSKGTLSHINHRTRGFMSSVGGVANFGLGRDTIVDRIRIIWPDGSEQAIDDVKSNQRIRIVKETTSVQETAPVKKTAAIKKTVSVKDTASDKETDPKIIGDSESLNRPLFKRVEIKGLYYLHQEMPYNDFDYQTLIPHQLSKFGPSLAVGDIDNNGIDDVYVGGANGSAGKLLFQAADGTFSNLQVEDTLSYENQGSLLLDIDNDNDLDLYIVSGGVEHGRKSRYYSDRLFINTGNRTFKKASLDFPRENGSCAVAADYDKDGDLDIFVGGASKPEEYPMSAPSMLLRNDTRTADKPVLTDLAETRLPELRSLGIVRSALWSDYDNDGWIDLLIVGEFMPLTIFKNEKGTLRKIDPDLLPNELGVWNSINGGDFDSDGDIDYLLGNIGLNSRHRPSPERPISLYAKDFDSNGTIDPIMTKFSDGKEVPVHLRDDLLKQLNMLKKIMPTYKEYSEASIEDLIPRKELNDALTLKWNYSASTVLINDGNGQFHLQNLPNKAQIAPIYGTLIKDFDADGNLDILAVGNSHSTEIFAGWMDASVGWLLLGKGDGTFDFSSLKESGFYVDGDAKALADVKRTDNSFLTLVSLNNDSLQSYQRSTSKKVKVITLQPTDTHAEITYTDGKKERREFYYGAGYLSQGSRSLPLSDKLESIKIINSVGTARLVRLDGG